MTMECEIDSLEMVYGDIGEVPFQRRRRTVDSCYLRGDEIQTKRLSLQMSHGHSESRSAK